MKILSKGLAFFGYDATKSHSQRNHAPSKLRGEDAELPPEKRKKLLSRSRDIRRNFEIARWAINKHLDFTSDFNFRSATGVGSFDDEVNAFMREWSQPTACDVTERFSLRRLVRMIEALRTVDGDLLVVTLADGRLQIIEGDRIKNPPHANGDTENFVHGVKLGPFGRHAGYAVHRRTKHAFEYERTLKPENAILHGYFDRYDQVRGVSPAAASLNRYRDVYENFDYAMARGKLSQLYGLVVKRRPDDDLPDDDAPGSEEPGEQPAQFEFDPDKGPMQVDLATDESVELLESKTPSVEFQNFNQAMISVALKALDLPYSFYDEAYTNFFGSKSAFQLYLKSAKSKRDDNRELLNRVTRWRLRLAILDGRLKPQRHGLTIDRMKWNWTPAGNPWLDASREVRGDLMAIHAGFTDYEAVVAERSGEDFYEVVDRLKEQRAYLREAGVAVEAPQNLFAPDGTVETAGSNGKQS